MDIQKLHSMTKAFRSLLMGLHLALTRLYSALIALYYKISDYYRPVLIHIIRLLPLLCASAILFGAIETLWSINTDNYETSCDGSYITYNTPIADCISIYLCSTYDKIFLLFLLSKVFLFCPYHRVFIWFMLGNRVMDEVCKRVVWSCDVSKPLAYFICIAWVVCLFIALYLHQKYGDREIN